MTLGAVADAYVDGTLSLVDTNFGTATTIRADASPDTLTYLRFNVPE